MAMVTKFSFTYLRSGCIYDRPPVRVPQIARTSRIGLGPVRQLAIRRLCAMYVDDVPLSL